VAFSFRKRQDGRPRAAIVRQTRYYELQLQREAEALRDAGYDVELIHMRQDGSPSRQVVNGIEVSTLRGSMGRSSKLRYMFDYARFFALVAGTLTARHLRRPYAVIQVNTMPDFLVFATVLPKLFGSRVVAYMHEPSPELAESLFGPGRVSRTLARVEQLVLRFADHSIAVTDQLKERYVERGAKAEAITVVLNGADPESLLGDWSPAEADVDEKVFTVVCHGSIEDRYGQDTIVEAARILKPELPDLRVVIVGRGKATEALVAQIAEADIGDVVSFEGWVSDDRLRELLHSADAGIVAQKATPYSHLVSTNKMVDYWIFGLPVIASRLRAVSELCDDSTLEFYEPGDSADLARAIRHLHDDPARREELARNGRRAEQELGWSVQRQKYLGVFDALMRRG
jgi:glycosyltransferase involved in cell wall biosynthesis